MILVVGPIRASTLTHFQVGENGFKNATSHLRLS